MADCAAVQLTAEEVDAAIDRFFRNLTDVRVRYSRGIVTDEELTDRVAAEISNAFRDCFVRKGFRLVMETKLNWLQYKEEYGLYKAGIVGAGESGDDWLLFDGREAAPEDKNQLFRMNDLLCLPVDFYMPIDAELDSSIPRPDRKQETHTYGGCTAYNLYLMILDDGGLMRDETPIGKTFGLKTDKGLSVSITVTGYERTLSGAVCGITGDGWIEGYTDEASRDQTHLVLRWDRDGIINRVSYMERREDYAAYMRFPLWQAYFAKADERAERRKQWYKNCIEKLGLKTRPVTG